MNIEVGGGGTNVDFSGGQTGGGGGFGFGDFLGPVVNTITSFIQANQNRNFAREMADKNAALQREFAQNGIRWRMEDANRSGIHPLYAMGANTSSASPVYTGQESDDGPIAGMGQNISRAMQATMQKQEREASVMTELQQERAWLENALLRSRIAREQAQVGPPLPSNSDMNYLTGQGNSGSMAPSMGGAYVEENPLQRVHSAPGRPAQEVGAVSDYGYARTNSGIAIVPSKDVKERIEDNIVPEVMWSVRNLLAPNFGGGPAAPDPRHYPPGKGKEWKWNYRAQEFQAREPDRVKGRVQ